MSVLVRDRLSTPRSSRRGLMGLGASAQESHPELLRQAEQQAASVGITLECREELTQSPGLPPLYNRLCRALCPSGQWSGRVFGADYIAPGGYALTVLRTDMQGECAAPTPTDQWVSGQITATGSSTSGGSKSPAAPPPVTPTASIVNLTRGGASFTVGDRFQLTIRGAANQPVTGTALQNGVNLGTTAYGSTDATGVRVLTGEMDASTVGTWTEIWAVGGVKASPLSFQVAAAPTAPKPPADQSGQSQNKSGSSKEEVVIKGSAGGRQGSAMPPAGSNPDAPTISIPDLIEQVPWWAWVVAGVGVTYMATRRSGR